MPRPTPNRLRRCLAALAGTALLVGTASNAQLTAGTTEPGRRAGAAMTVDPRTGAVLLFGGYTQQDGAEVQLADTWQWRNGCWRRFEGEGPSARSWASLTHVPEARGALLFGGKVDNSEDGTFGDTWLLQRDRWTLVEADHSPPPRSHHAATWDDAAKRLVLFGGSRGFEILGDSWTWSDEKWSKIETTTGPHARALHVAYFDPQLGGAVVHGGSSNPWPPLNLSDRWVLRGSEYHPLPPGPARAYHVAGRVGPGVVVTTGWGFEAEPVLASWLEDDGNWHRLPDPDSAPLPRAGAASAVDRTAGVLYLYGGMDEAFEPLDDFWRFDGREWTILLGCHR